MSIKEFISSGILELYVMGAAGSEDIQEVERMAAMHPEIRDEIESISQTIEQLAMSARISPGRNVKPFLIATIDYMERIKSGEKATIPPVLNEKSELNDYASWLNRDDMVMPNDAEDIFAKIIGSIPGTTTAIVWIERDTPAEVHNDEFEKFLIAEGTCDIIVENEIHHLVPGDFFAIPLHKSHVVKVTSEIPCKVILQRVAA
jgi:mannose-6-phosphate isomerase-like protein (cupin superfamily)